MRKLRWARPHAGRNGSAARSTPANPPTRGSSRGVQFAVGAVRSLHGQPAPRGLDFACVQVMATAGSPARPPIGPLCNGCSPTSTHATKQGKRKSSDEGLEQGNSIRCRPSAKPSWPASTTRAGFCLRAGYGDGGFSGATTDRPALQRLLADITAGRASAIRSAASSPTSSLALRYWNRARRRYHRLSAGHSRARVSLPTQAARPGPDNRGKPRLLDRERRIPARDRFAPDSPLEGSGFELLVPRQEKPGISGASQHRGYL
jgi:hypothetical protein